MATATFRNANATITVLLTTETCANCGTIFAMTDEVNAALRRTGASFYCPAGHAQHYTETEAQKLQRQLDEVKRLKEIADRRADNACERLETERKNHAATKGKLTKTRNRIQAGVCPDCNRHFTNVERHMASQHPVESQA